jgi:hypothetical protein
LENLGRVYWSLLLRLGFSAFRVFPFSDLSEVFQRALARSSNTIFHSIISWGFFGDERGIQGNTTTTHAWELKAVRFISRSLEYKVELQYLQ